MIAQAAKAICQVLAVGRRHSAFAGRHDLARMKREATDIAERPDRAALIGRTDRAGGVLDDREPMALSDIENFRHRSRQAE